LNDESEHDVMTDLTQLGLVFDRATLVTGYVCYKWASHLG